MRLLVLAPVLLLLLGGLLTYGWRGPRTGTITAWGVSHGLGFTAANRPMVERHLRRARRLRMAGALAGLALLAAPGGWLWVLVGYLAGAVLAEAAPSRPLGDGPPSALLVPRDLSDYLPGALRRAQRTTAALAPVLAIVAVAVPFGRSKAVDLQRLSDGAAVALGLTGPAVAAGLEAVQRWIVSRRQPGAEADLVEADDALRAQSVTSVSAAGIGILLLVLGPLWWSLALSDVQVLRWTAWAPAVLCWLGALVSCFRFGAWPWVVSRPVPPGPMSAAAPR